MQDETLRHQKATLRQSLARMRAECLGALGADAAEPWLRRALSGHGGAVLAGYMPMRSEISPLGAMAAHRGATCLPVVVGPDMPLRFRAWSAGEALVPGGFGTRVPAAGAWCRPDILIVPLLAFDSRGYRLGYGGGFYDRTLAALRAEGGCLAIGLAFAGQQIARVPAGPHDAPLDLIVTEAGEIRP
jgi:5-formyltetrahydrofolate cyclo-ligase